MYNNYNSYPCSYCAYGACPCPYYYNPNFMREFDEQYFPNEEEFDYDNSLDFSEEDSRLIELKDYGPEPFVINIDEATKRNRNYRTTLWTGKHLQLTLMSIKVGGDIGLEVHPAIDQFIRIEEGQGIVQMGPSKNNLNLRRRVSDGFAIFIPAGTWHNVINTGNRPLKLYSIYAPPQHPHGTVHETKEIAHGASRD
ncbi:cupin domain-containing protein [Clostridium omnivorum]|nr:cupin domain-containing protein [Clostridium sp. E14]